MATNSEVLQDALGLIGVTDDFNMPPEHGALALRAMNDMLTMWEANEVDVGYFEQDSLTDDNPVDAEYLMAVKYNLAVALAPYYSKEPAGALVALARDTYKALVRKEQVSRLEAVDTLNAPQGESWGYGYNILTDS
jgi:hypothetical protein